MRLRIAVVFVGALFVVAWMPGAASGHHKSKHADKSAQVAGTTEPAFAEDHRFVPDNLTVRAAGTVEFKNDEFNVAGRGAPHSWTVLTEECKNNPTTCAYTTEVLDPGQTQTVDLKGLPAGTYTFICTVGQEGGPPFSLVLPPHSEKTDDGWTGMVGELTVTKP